MFNYSISDEDMNFIINSLSVVANFSNSSQEFSRINILKNNLIADLNHNQSIDQVPIFLIDQDDDNIDVWSTFQGNK